MENQYYVIITVKTGSDKNDQWRIYWERNFDEEHITCIVLKGLTIVPREK